MCPTKRKNQLKSVEFVRQVLDFVCFGTCTCRTKRPTNEKDGKLIVGPDDIITPLRLSRGVTSKSIFSSSSSSSLPPLCPHANYYNRSDNNMNSPHLFFYNVMLQYKKKICPISKTPFIRIYVVQCITNQRLRDIFALKLTIRVVHVET